MKQSQRIKDIKEQKDELFSEVMARTASPSKAIAAAYPDTYERNKAYAGVKANRMLQKPDIQAKINQKLEKMAPKALKRAQELISSDNEAVATANIWKTVEHIRGKPIARNINSNINMTVEDAISNLE